MGRCPLGAAFVKGANGAPMLSPELTKRLCELYGVETPAELLHALLAPIREAYRALLRRQAVAPSRGPRGVRVHVTRREARGRPRKANAPPDKEGEPSHPRRGRPRKAPRCDQRLGELLTHGLVPSLEVEAILGGEGFSSRLIDERRKVIGIVSVWRDGRWWMQLPGEPIESRGLLTWPLLGENPEDTSGRHREYVRASLPSALGVAA